MKVVRILLVDDEEEILGLLTRRLTRRGHQVTTAADSKARLKTKFILTGALWMTLATLAGGFRAHHHHGSRRRNPPGIFCPPCPLCYRFCCVPLWLALEGWRNPDLVEGFTAL